MVWMVTTFGSSKVRDLFVGGQDIYRERVGNKVEREWWTGIV